MTVWSILGWILLGIAVLVILISLLPVTVGILGGYKRESDLWVRVAGITLWRKSDSPSPKEEKKTANPKPKKKTDFATTVRLVVQVIRIVFSHLPKMLSGVRAERLELECIAADADAADCAMQYGAACSVIYPLIEYMREKLHLREKNTVLDIRCDFDREEPVFVLETEISMRVFHILYAAIHMLLQKLREDMANE